VEWRLLDSLEEDVRRRVMAAARRRVFTRNEVIFHEGDPGDTLHFVLKGHVAIRVATPMGERATLAVLGPGETFGELALLGDGSDRTATAAAVEGAETMSLHRRDFLDIRRTDPSIERMIVDALSARVGRLTGHLVEALYEPVEVRLVRRLVALCETYDDDRSETINLPLTQEDLASMAGTTRPTANRILKELEDSGVLAVARGRIEVLDIAALERSAR
jgi:CRP-like cAMP-binding protein